MRGMRPSASSDAWCAHASVSPSRCHLNQRVPFTEQAIFGHASIGTSQWYARLGEARVRAAVFDTASIVTRHITQASKACLAKAR